MIERNGYLMKWVPGRNQPNGTSQSRGRYVYVHRLVMEESIGRYLDSDELVHHINENKLDNRIENLEIISRADHAREHIKRGSWGIAQPGVISNPCPQRMANCAWCGAEFQQKHIRLKCCSHSCGQKRRYAK